MVQLSPPWPLNWPSKREAEEGGCCDDWSGNEISTKAVACWSSSLKPQKEHIVWLMVLALLWLFGDAVLVVLWQPVGSSPGQGNLKVSVKSSFTCCQSNSIFRNKGGWKSTVPQPNEAATNLTHSASPHSPLEPVVGVSCAACL